MTPNDEATSGTQQVKIGIETGLCIIVGTVFVPATGYHGRLSDLLNQKGRFLSVTDATVYCPRDAQEPVYTASYLAVNLNSIDIVRPVE